MIGYKVVTKDLMSVSMGPFGFHYSQNEWTWQPEGGYFGPLSVFEKLQSVIDFMNSGYRSVRIFECEYLTAPDQETMWILLDDKRRITYRRDFPLYTVLATRVRLTKEIFFSVEGFQ